MAIEQAVDDGQPTTNQRRKAKIERTDVNVGDEESEEIIKDLLGLLNDYRDCVAVDANEIGCYGELSMEIKELPGSKPLYSKPYSVSEAERKKIRDIVSEWRKIGVVTDTNLAYASPVLLVKKKTGETRMVFDYRRLNNQTVRINFPLPNINDHVALLAGSKLFIVLDLAQGYLQLPIEPKDKHKTAFITPEETGEFTRMIFILTNAPFYFTKMMQRVLGPLRNNVVLFYLDDVMIPGRDWIDLKERLIMVLEASNELIPDESESEELNVRKTNKSDEMHKRKGKDSNNDNLNYQNKIKRCKLNDEQIEMSSNVRRSDRFKN